MAIDLTNGYRELMEHVGHKVEVANYGDDENVVVECITCGCILIDFDKPDDVQQGMKRKILVSEDKATELEDLCNEPAADCGRGEVIFDEEVTFDNGNRMVIQVIAPEDPGTEPCWTQGVLFSPEGCELGCTEVQENFLGDYKVDEHVVVVVIDENAWKRNLHIGDEVYWNDPNGGLRSRTITISTISYHGDMAFITDINGDDIEVFRHELS